MTFQQGEIPANLGGKGTPACANDFPGIPRAARLGIVVSHTQEGLSSQGSRVPLGTGAAWKTVPSASAGIRAAAEVLISLKDGFSPFGWN